MKPSEIGRMACDQWPLPLALCPALDGRSPTLRTAYADLLVAARAAVADCRARWEADDGVSADVKRCMVTNFVDLLRLLQRARPGQDDLALELVTLLMETLDTEFVRSDRARQELRVLRDAAATAFDQRLMSGPFFRDAAQRIGFGTRPITDNPFFSLDQEARFHHEDQVLAALRCTALKILGVTHAMGKCLSARSLKAVLDFWPTTTGAGVPLMLRVDATAFQWQMRLLLPRCGPGGGGDRDDILHALRVLRDHPRTADLLWQALRAHRHATPIELEAIEALACEDKGPEGREALAALGEGGRGLWDVPQEIAARCRVRQLAGERRSDEMAQP